MEISIYFCYNIVILEMFIFTVITGFIINVIFNVSAFGGSIDFMKNVVKIILLSGLALSISACTPSDVLNNYVDQSENSPEDTISPVPKQRVYMDEVTGTLQDFTGSSLTMKNEDRTYIFDISEATLECKEGMITGDEISVIYEGQLADNDVNSVKALKVVDEFHKKEQLEIRKAYGKIQSLTPNTITIKTKKGKTATYPITGTEQYYQNGIHTGNWVYIHFKGQFTPTDSTKVLNASHLKVLSISDIDPLKLPDPTPTPDPVQSTDETTKEKQFHATIQNLSDNQLTVCPSSSDTSLTIDMSQIPCYFKGGAAPGSYVNVTYTGDFQETSLDQIQVIAVTGDDPDSLGTRNLSYTVSGVITGHTANTVTISTADGASVTCFTEGIRNTSTSGMESGASICITFDPVTSKTSNIYTSVKIEDA